MILQKTPEQVGLCHHATTLLEELTCHLPAQSKHAKRLRAFRNAARDAVKPIGPKLTAYGKRVAKERAKIVAALAHLQQFEPVSSMMRSHYQPTRELGS